ncbi:hypothetical protein QYF36_011494 [Acer negundo]|nr:hypothetical protein QYF36_011494 [Acer negundo]
MTKKKLELDDHRHQHEHELEIVKAVAQAWYGHSSSSRTTNEFDAYRRNFRGQPSRFKLEAMNKLPSSSTAKDGWDFRQSLWDSYEIVTVSKRLETGLTLDDHSRVHRRHRESKNSLRNMFYRLSSRRYNPSEVPGEEDDDEDNRLLTLLEGNYYCFYSFSYTVHCWGANEAHCCCLLNHNFHLKDYNTLKCL